MPSLARVLCVLTAVTLAAISGTRPAAAQAARTCELPDELGPGAAELPKTAASLRTGAGIKIVAIGSGSTAGNAAGGADRAYPERLAVALRARFPDANVAVVNRGSARATAHSMLERLDRDVIAERPTLVIWQTGTVDAVRRTDIDDFHDAVNTGVERLTTAGFEILLIDTQFSQRTDSVIDTQRYDATLREIASLHNVPLFPRHDLMRHWAETDVFHYNATPAAEQRAMIIGVYDCIGRALAEFIVRAFPSTAPIHP